MSNFTLHDLDPEIARYVVKARIDGIRQGYNILVLELEGGRRLSVQAVGKLYISLSDHQHSFTPPQQ